MSTWTSLDLPATIYLNERLVIDFLATMEDGLIQVSTLTKLSSSESNDAYSVEGTAGTGGLVSRLISLTLKGSTSNTAKSTGQEQEAGQRAHTSGSLFAKLRGYLQQESIMKRIESDADVAAISAGDIVEFQALLTRNPLVQALEGLRKLMSLSGTFTSNTSTPSSTQPVSRQERRRSNPQYGSVSNELVTILQQIDSVLEDVTAGGRVDIIGTILGTQDLRAVILSNDKWFVEFSSQDVVDGEFRVIGKVARIIRDDTSEFNLLRKSSLGYIGKQNIAEMLSGFSNSADSGIVFPVMETSISGPALQIVPVAIFT
jgi:hypothetical protein